jgi:tetratricopeptide (TPR) repeat protein
MQTKDTLPQAIEAPSIQERIEFLLDELGMAIKWDRPLISFAVYRSEYVRNDILLVLKRLLAPKGKELIQLDVDKKHFDVPLLLRDDPEVENKVFSISRLSRGGGRGYSNAYRALNMHREYLIDSKALSLFWITPAEARQVAKHAPDFWAFRHVVVAFQDLPSTPEIEAPVPGLNGNAMILQACMDLLKNDPRDLKVLTAIAKAYYALGCYEDAVFHVRKALRMQPEDPNLSLLLSDIYLGMKRPVESNRIRNRLNGKVMDPQNAYH